MAKQLVSDKLWEIVEPLLAPELPKPKGGRLRIEDRAALSGHHLRLEERYPLGDALPGDGLRFRSHLLWRRLREWQQAEAWELLHKVLLDRLGEADRTKRGALL